MDWIYSCILQNDGRNHQEKSNKNKNSPKKFRKLVNEYSVELKCITTKWKQNKKRMKKKTI